MVKIYPIGDCGRDVPPGHVLCAPCASAMQCTVCKRKLRLANFATGANTCNACERKKSSKKQTGGGSAINRVFVARPISVDDYIEDEGLLEFLTNRRDQIQNILEEELNTRR